MGRVLFKNNLGDPHVIKNWEGPNSENEDWSKRQLRRMRRHWKKELMLSLHSSNHNCRDGPARTASKSCRNKASTGKNENFHFAADEIDEDYKTYLENYFSNLAIVNSNDDTDSDYRTHLENAHSDPDYRTLEDGYLDPDYGFFLENYAEKDNSDVFPLLENERRPCNKRPHQDVTSVSEHNCHSDVKHDFVDEDYWLYLDGYISTDSESIEKSLNGRGNSQVFDQAIDIPGLQSEIDEEYNVYLNSDNNLEGDWVYTPERNTTKTNNKNGGIDSSDSDLILLEPYQICENTPFISSKAYDSSCFEDEVKPGESKQLLAYDPCQFRSRLMEYLERSYDQKEYDSFMHEVYQKRQKECNRETRQGVKSYQSHGVNKSYLELYPDFAKVIDEFKEQPHKVLFLLRGFFFWLQNIIYGEKFQPWHDQICLEILRNM